MKVTIYGAGYVGLVTGVCFADIGHDVMCMDVDADKIAQLQQANAPIYEPGLDDLLEKNLQTGRLQFTTDISVAVQHGLFQFIAVGTPPDEDGAADLQYVLAVANNIGRHMQDYKIIVTKSTVPVGTADQVAAAVRASLQTQNIPFAIAANPEFLKEGMAINDFLHPDRIIVGAEDQEALRQLHELYQPLIESSEQWISMDIRSAELTKYAANAMLATKISFINEISQIAEKLGADIENIRRGIAADQRIGRHFIRPGCGYGGSCFPKDVHALRKSAENVGLTPQLLTAVEAVNHRQKQLLFGKINDYFHGDLANKIIAVWGLAFKPDTDDMREASSRELIAALWDAHARIKVYDPIAINEAKRIYGERSDLEFCDSALSTLANVDALAIVTEWNEFKTIDLQQLKQHLQNPLIFDGRNIFDPTQMRELGITYFSIGRPQQNKA